MQNILSYLTEKENSLVIYQKCRKDEVLFHEDDLCELIGIVVDGRIDIISYSFSGKEVLYNSLGRNEIFGNNLVFSDYPHYRGNITCKEDTLVAIIKKDSLIQILQNNQQFLLEYLKIQSNFGKSLNSKIKLLSFNNALDRFDYYLYSNGNKIHYKNVADLARLLFMERETLSRLLSNLEKEGVIQRDKHLIVKLF